MVTKWSVIYLFATACFVNEVNAKFCERTEAVTRLVEVTFSSSYIESYRGQCYYGCIKSRWATSVNRRYVPKREWKTVKYCCSGYLRTDDSSNDSDITCEPICMPACKNGHCTAPTVCTCDMGYDPDPANTHNCLPSCQRSCEHGTCVAPDTCQCDFGYTLVNSTCQPVCTEPCHNGTCIAPETCECLPGYRKSEKNLCEPYCSNGCDHGFCAAPETCCCNSGWHLKENKDKHNEHCEPICSKPCDNGTCVAPDTCECKAYYTKSKGGICEPVCRPPCGNGTCIAPQTCSCFPGYHVDEDNLYALFPNPNLPGCRPTCPHCKDAHCIAPNKCYPIEILSTGRKLPDPIYDDDYSSYDDYYSDQFWDTYVDTRKTIASKSTYPGETKSKSIINPFFRSTPLDDSDTDIFDYSYGTTVDMDSDAIDNSIDKRTNSMTKSTQSYDTNTVTGPTRNPNLINESTHSKDASTQSMTWLQHHWATILIPVLVIVTAAAIMLLVWQWAPIIVFFKGRSYVVEGYPVETNGSRAFEDIQISAINEKKKTTEK